ncbi:Trimethylamine methyltransferase (MTTB) [Pelagimonas phthalicica]|uniref:Methyltransferase n=1 Tax=Pelagimonas phthalicica TaxID=1037362 RepID=A0A238J880_9RHOB|nr:trimethylamine methyltransferase family protein [Pelagimonas phthalicica]TDS95400.1 trimethylamine--corrinoid protein Co-methyltransferase [Pelagimonas phthalicica]SMX26076.1 Trimethylamine methyltransferase (MTTB) [Pelagimonas phthalicica]
MARRSRALRRSPQTDTASLPSPYIQRELPFFDVLNEEQLQRMEAQVDWLLEDVGIAFRDDPAALEIWCAAGVAPTGEHGDLIKADAKWIRDLCAKAPGQFTQLARNPARNVTIGGENQVFAPIYGAPFVRDLAGGRRYGNMADFEKLVKLAYMHPNLHHTGLVITEPTDIPVSKRHLDMVFAHITLSDKPHLGAITEKSRAQDSVDMAEILFGRARMDAEAAQGNICIMGNVNTNSPLLVDKVASEAIQVYSARGQGMIVTPFILTGAMGPVSTAASVAQAVAEAMICCAFAQLVRPGAPFVMGNFLSSMSLKSGAPTFGMPEPVLSNYVIGQMARRVGLPLRCGGSLTASKIEDAQAAYESADSMHSTMLAGSNFTLHAAGWLEGGLATGFEKLIMDADRLGSYQKLGGLGLETDENAFARDAYGEVQPGGHFLGSGHTMRNYQTAFYEPKLSDSENVESWEEGGSKDMRQRAFERWNDMLNQYETPPIDIATKEELTAYVARRKEELPDAWY